MSKRKEGCIYLRGSIYWIKYTRNGRPFCESSHSDKISDARFLLAKRLGEKVDGKPIVKRRDVLFSELLDDLIADYKVNNRSGTSNQEQRVDRHIRPKLGHLNAANISGAVITKYIIGRQTPIQVKQPDGTLKEIPPAKNATINRELSAIRRAFTLGMKHGKIQYAPPFEMLVENNARQGFFEADQYASVLNRLPDYVKPIVAFANLTGWRKGEILALEWREVDLKNSVIRLDAQKTKNKTARTIYMTAAVKELLKAQRTYTDEIQKLRGVIIASVFHRDGGEVQSFYKAWKTACTAAGVPGMLFHDFRRTHVRRLVRAGVPERVAMQQTGHRSRAVFERYNIISDSDLREAAKKLDEAAELQSGYNGKLQQTTPSSK